MPDLLLEIGLEEVPARMLPAAQAELLKRTLALLTREQLIGSDPITHAYSTPRRLAVLIRDVVAQQADITEDTTGPALKIAFKDGIPTPAAEAFARKAGVSVEDLRTITTPKGDYLAATTIKRGRPAAEVLAAELPKEIAALYWAKNMYWRPGKPERFVRPVLWLACLLGEEVVPVTFAGKTAGRASYGHRILSSGEPFEIQSPGSYLAQLEGEYVLADVELRRHKIRKALDHTTRTVPGLRWREDHALVDAVTHLTEWPDVLLGTFEPAYLTLPEEVLVTVMRDHQKYFAVEDATGTLTNYFLTVTNIALDETNTPIIKQGNERVLRARFNDARFFWDFDQKITLQDRVKLLENVTFQKDLGSYAAKSERMEWIAIHLLGNSPESAVFTRLISDAADDVKQAIKLAKADLTTELVKEFTELQGIIGSYYANEQGANEIVASAIYDQYLPASADDRIPRNAVGCLLGLVDRLDTLVGMFGLRIIPTGSKDPFALRRAGSGIAKILAEGPLPLKLSDCIKSAVAFSSFATEDTIGECISFITARFEHYLTEVKGLPHDVVMSVVCLPTLVDDFGDTVARAEAVASMKGSEDFEAVCASFKRMKNILAQAGEQERVEFPSAATVHPAEQALRSASVRVNEQFVLLSANHEYVEALAILATLRPEIDTFFNEVMVMDPDPYVRNVRLGLLDGLIRNFSRIADFSEIVTAG